MHGLQIMKPADQGAGAGPVTGAGQGASEVCCPKDLCLKIPATFFFLSMQEQEPVFPQRDMEPAVQAAGFFNVTLQ